MRESTLEKWIAEQVKARGGLALKFVSPGRAGVPDRICIFPGGRVIFIEVKRPGLKDGLSPLQRKMRDRLTTLGCTVWRIADKEEFLRRLEHDL